MGVLNNSMWNVSSADADFYDYQIGYSCRFGDAQNNYLDSPNFQAGADKKYTLSLWCKRGDVTRYQAMLGCSAGNWSLAWDADDTLKIPSHTTVETKGIFRDTSAWYHIVVAVDTTQGTAANRVKIYINGTQETSFSTSSKSKPAKRRRRDNCRRQHCI